MLATKLFVPRPPKGLVSRPRLAARLDEGLRCGLTLVSAPAGFGKTALLAHWATASDIPLAWLTLDGGDNDPVRFWRYLAHALDRTRAGLAERVDSTRGTAVPAFDAVITAIVNTLASEPAPVVLVLDDYHVIENDLVHDSLRRLLEVVPPEVTVVLSGRADPPIPLGRRRAGNRLCEVRTADLRFTPEEAAELVSALIGPSTVLPHAATAALASRTEGWAAGLQLAALSLQGGQNVTDMLASFSGSHRFILDYLTEEVLAHQPEPLQAFLHETSVLGVLQGPLCDAVTGRSDSQETLEAIESANLFLVPLDDVRGRWRYHHLFGDLLYSRIRRQSPTRVRDLHRAAATWHENHGVVEEAIKHALAGDDSEMAARLVERHVDEYLMSSELVTLRHWLRQLAPEGVTRQPRLLLTQARLALLAGQIAEAIDLLAAAEGAYPLSADAHYEPSVGRPAGPLANVPAIIAVNRAFIANLQGDPDAASAFATQALADVEDDEWMLDSLARLPIAVAAWLRGRPDQAEPTLASVIDRWFTHGADDYAVVWSYFLGQVQAAQGRVEAAARTYRRALNLVPGERRRPTAGAVLVGSAQLAYSRDDLSTAERHLDVAVPLCRGLGYTQPLAIGLALQALVREAGGDPSGANLAMAEAGDLSASGVVDLINPVPAMRAGLWLKRGDVEAAAGWIHWRGLRAEDQPRYPHEAAYLVLVRVLMHEGRSTRALRLLDRLLAAATRPHRDGSRVEIQVLRAMLLADRDEDGALEALGEALRVTGGHARVIIDEGKPMAALLGRFVAARREPGSGAARTLRRLVRTIGEVDQRADARRYGKEVVTGLTSREREVLRLLATGRANREIAGELFVSPHTVKRHVTHILDKLDAGNRTEAVARGRDLGLLD